MSVDAMVSAWACPLLAQSGHPLASGGPFLTTLGSCYDPRVQASGPTMRRRDFIRIVSGSAALWPLAAYAQQTERMRRIGVLMLYPESDPQGQLRATAFQQGLQR